MATALSFLSSVLLAPVQAVVLFFAPHAAVTRVPVARTVQPSALPAAASQQRMHAHTKAPSQTLRVLRVSEAGIPAGSAGRMRMSGRFADVCAELDRMAAQEMRTA